MPRKLPYYLKQYRRRAGFSQADVAYLLGATAKTKVSRYERGRHLPELRAAFALEAMLGVPVAELFPSAFKEARRAIIRRARGRSAMLAGFPQNGRTARRQRSLEKILA
ncbi:MAG TPA: helix-turn-helix transcriptional regulator [Gemmatimonadaceae bacterium]|nr:helix-turn-helix transcriptional regulator [Gemmatimonadaceae bacterium]